METVDLNKDPYFLRNHLGTYVSPVHIFGPAIFCSLFRAVIFAGQNEPEEMKTNIHESDPNRITAWSCKAACST